MLMIITLITLLVLYNSVFRRWTYLLKSFKVSLIFNNILVLDADYKLYIIRRSLLKLLICHALLVSLSYKI